MNGLTVETVASSWIEALGGLSQRYMRNVPPGCWASADVVIWSPMAARRPRPVIDKRCGMRIPRFSTHLASEVSGERVGDGVALLFSSARSMNAAAGPWQAHSLIAQAGLRGGV